MKITTKIKSKHLSNVEKRFLYDALVHDKREEIRVFRNMLDKFVIDLVKKNLLNEELEYLMSRPYCISTSYTTINSKTLGLPENYCGEDLEDESKRNMAVVGMSINVYLKDFTIPDITTEIISCPRNNRTIDITKELVKVCSEDEISLLKDHLMKRAKLEYELSSFGIGTYIKSSRYSRAFSNISTWGQVLKNSKEHFEILYNRFIVEEGEEENLVIDKTKGEEEILLEKVKKILKY